MKLNFLYKPVCDIRSVKYKTLVVMKLTAIFLLIGSLHLAAAGYSQKVTISRKYSSLESVFKDIKQQTGYIFFYSGNLDTENKLLNLNLKDAPLTEALDNLAKIYNLSYKIVDRTIVVMKGNTVVPNSVIQGIIAKRLEITGKVLDKTSGQGMPGVNITFKNSKELIAQTNSEGEFKITAQPGDILVFSYVGYKPIEVKIVDGKPLTITLEDQVNNIETVVVTGYQTIKKDNYTGNAITISGEDLKRSNPQNILKALQSFDPSFRLLDNNLAGSDPNAMPRINVRGATALPAIPTNADDLVNRENLSAQFNLPAFILDGFEVSLQKVVDLDINRIESVTLLKDAAATAVYGSRAANGVMVITTKAPAAGKLQVFYNSELQITAPDLSGYNVLNASEKIAYEQRAGLFTNMTPGVGNDTQDNLDAQLFSRLKNVASGVNTYWLSQPLRNTYGQRHSLSAQGGDQAFRYGVDLRYQTMPGVMKESTRDRFSGGMNFNYNPNTRLLIRNDISVNQTNGVNSNYGSFSDYAYMNPYYPIADSLGRTIQELATWRVNTFRDNRPELNQFQYIDRYVFNPLHEGSLSNFSKNSYFEMVDALSVDYKILESLRLRALVSLNNTISKSDNFLSPLSKEFYGTSTNDLNKRGIYNYDTTNELK
ncbi:MAG: SusC/RagA family TonB-linked outer membrane protein, partial [Pedobacter sp.]